MRFPSRKDALSTHGRQASCQAHKTLCGKRPGNRMPRVARCGSGRLQEKTRGGEAHGEVRGVIGEYVRGTGPDTTYVGDRLRGDEDTPPTNS